MLKRITIIAAVFAGVVAAVPAHGLDYYLKRDLGVQGLYHRCLYSDGNVYTYNATELCPLSIHLDEPPMSNGRDQKMTGFLDGEYRDGLTKVCVYTVLGAKRAVRMSSVAIRPPTYSF
jgi:hypothetical protein